MTAKDNLLNGMITRIILTFFSVYYFPIPLYIKILILVILDFYDGIIFCRDNCLAGTNSHLYGHLDKIFDIISYSFLMHYIYTKTDITEREKKIILDLYLFRMLGFFMYFTTSNRDWFFYFPDFYIDISLLVALVQSYPSLGDYQDIIAVILIIKKMYQEMKFHFGKKDRNLNIE
jgi:hypothetical protein